MLEKVNVNICCNEAISASPAGECTSTLKSSLCNINHIAEIISQMQHVLRNLKDFFLNNFIDTKAFSNT